MGIGEDIDDMGKCKAQIMGERFRKGQADERQLGKKQNNAQHRHNPRRRSVENLPRSNQPILLFRYALILEYQIEDKGDD